MSSHYPDHEYTLPFKQFSNGWMDIKLTQIKNLVIFVEKMKIPWALSSMQQFCFYPKQTQNNWDK